MKKLDTLVDKIADQVVERLEGSIRKMIRQEFEYYLEDKGVSKSKHVMHDKSSGNSEPSKKNEGRNFNIKEAVSQNGFNPKLQNHPSMAGGEDVADVRHGKNAQKYADIVTKDYSSLID